MRALILIAGAALAVAAPAAARPHHDDGERHHDQDRYESPYSNEAVHRERERKELAREIAKAERKERDEYLHNHPFERDDSDSDSDDEDSPDDE